MISFNKISESGLIQRPRRSRVRGNDAELIEIPHPFESHCSGPSTSRLCNAGERGFSLVSAIFLLVILAGLGVAMVNISTTQQNSSALDVQGARAYQAAKAGVEWGLYQRLRLGAACTGVPATFQLPATATTLNSFYATVKCVQTAGPGVLVRYQIISTACNQPQVAEPRCPNPSASPDYMQRVVQVEF